MTVCVCSLVCDASNRLGANVHQLMSHPFFHNTDWEHIRDRPAAIPVHVKHMADTSNFDDFEELDEQKRCESVQGGGVCGSRDVSQCGGGVVVEM